MSPHGAVAGLILAAGASRRMGTIKALLPVEGEKLLDRMVGLLSGGCSPVVVVLGYHAGAIRGACRRLKEALVVENPFPELGQLASLQCGLKALWPAVGRVIFTPVDYPALQAGTVQRIVEALGRVEINGQEGAVVIPTYRGRRGHPVGVAGRVILELLDLPQEAKASDVIHRHLGSALQVPVDDAGILCDVDEPEDAAFLRGGGEPA